MGDRIIENESSGRHVAYTYDNLHRLTIEAITDPVAGNRTLSYTYDVVGNRLSENDSLNGLTTYSYDNNDRDALLDDFQKLIGQDFQHDPEINLDIRKPHSPSCGRWMWINEGENFPLSTVWLAVIGGDIVGTESGEMFFMLVLHYFCFGSLSQ